MGEGRKGVFSSSHSLPGMDGMGWIRDGMDARPGPTDRPARSRAIAVSYQNDDDGGGEREFFLRRRRGEIGGGV